VLGNRELREILGPKRTAVTETGVNCTMTSLVIFTFHQTLLRR
jgi:hypothetical protein